MVSGANVNENVIISSSLLPLFASVRAHAIAAVGDSRFHLPLFIIHSAIESRHKNGIASIAVLRKYYEQGYQSISSTSSFHRIEQKNKINEAKNENKQVEKTCV